MGLSGLFQIETSRGYSLTWPPLSGLSVCWIYDEPWRKLNFFNKTVDVLFSYAASVWSIYDKNLKTCWCIVSLVSDDGVKDYICWRSHYFSPSGCDARSLVFVCEAASGLYRPSVCTRAGTGSGWNRCRCVCSWLLELSPCRRVECLTDSGWHWLPVSPVRSAAKTTTRVTFSLMCLPSHCLC